MIPPPPEFSDRAEARRAEERETSAKRSWAALDKDKWEQVEPKSTDLDVDPGPQFTQMDEVLSFLFMQSERRVEELFYEHERRIVRKLENLFRRSTRLSIGESRPSSAHRRSCSEDADGRAIRLSTLAPEDATNLPRPSTGPSRRSCSEDADGRAIRFSTLAAEDAANLPLLSNCSSCVALTGPAAVRDEDQQPPKEDEPQRQLEPWSSAPLPNEVHSDVNGANVEQTGEDGENIPHQWVASVASEESKASTASPPPALPEVVPLPEGSPPDVGRESSSKRASRFSFFSTKSKGRDTTKKSIASGGSKRPRKTVNDCMREYSSYKNSLKLAKQNTVVLGNMWQSDVSMADNMNRIVTSRPFELAVCSLIVLNSIIIGIEADFDMRQAIAGDAKTVFMVFNYIFLVAFSIELFLRILNERTKFLSMRNDKLRWNIFDSFLVLSGLVEECMMAFLSSSPDMSQMRVFRSFRLVRGLRLVRVLSFCKDLRIMLAGILRSLQSLVWALILLFAMQYLFAVCVLQFASEEARSQIESIVTGTRDGLSLDQMEFDALMEFYGGLFRTVYTLYMSILGGVDWGDAAAPLLALHTILGVMFCAYIAFGVICVLNIITGVFVENANRLSAQDDEMVMLAELETRSKWFLDVKEVFDAADIDGSGKLNIDEFKDMMADVRWQQSFRKLGVHVEEYSASGLFGLLDLDGGGELELDEFAIALQSVHGMARSIDVAKIGQDTRTLRNDVDAIRSTCDEILTTLRTRRGSSGDETRLRNSDREFLKGMRECMESDCEV